MHSFFKERKGSSLACGQRQQKKTLDNGMSYGRRRPTKVANAKLCWRPISHLQVQRFAVEAADTEVERATQLGEEPIFWRSLRLTGMFFCRKVDMQ